MHETQACAVIDKHKAVAPYSCYAMFYQCTSLLEMPQILCTNTDSYCYGSMFYGCKNMSIRNDEELPARVLSAYCYHQMFYGCTSITKAPYLPALELVSNCYSNMFQNCTNLNYVKADFVTKPGSGYTASWLSGVSSTGTFIKSEDAVWKVNGISGIPAGWTTYVHNYAMGLRFYANSQSTLTLSTSTSNPYLLYSYDMYEWIVWKYDEIMLDENECVYIRGVNPNGVSTASTSYSRFSINGDISLSGSIMRLIGEHADEVPCNYCFYTLFQGCNGLTSICGLDLSASVLSECCFHSMFRNCTSLVDCVESIDACVMPQYACYYMFYGCSSMRYMCDLPCEYLTDAASCYSYMFYGCTSLSVCKELPSENLAKNCYKNMFDGCSSLTTAPNELPAMVLYSNCYQYMFNNCVSLANAPHLPARMLVSGCYSHMFNGCSLLNRIEADFVNSPTYPSGDTTTYIITNFATGTATDGTFVKSRETCYTNKPVPNGWNVVYSDANNYVDLGLSVKWATFNLQGNGNVAMGNARGKLGYQYYSTRTDDEVIPPQYDHLTYFWENFRTPTKEEWEELMNDCTWEWMINPLYFYNFKNVRGYNVTGPNGNSIFLPVTGRSTSDGVVDTTTGFYWTATSYEENPLTQAYNVLFNETRLDFVSIGKTNNYAYRGVLIE